jgi:hypothetical protein
MGLAKVLAFPIYFGNMMNRLYRIEKWINGVIKSTRNFNGFVVLETCQRSFQRF